MKLSITKNISWNKISILIKLLIFFLLFIPLITKNKSTLNLFTLIYFYAYLAQAWNIAGGYCGLFSVGHASFFGVSAYVFLIALRYGNLNPVIAMMVSLIFVSFIAIIVGFASLRLQGIFFSMTTVALAEILRSLALHYRHWTGGAVGTYLPAMLGFSVTTSYYVGLFMVASITLLVWWISQSRIGKYFIAIRENTEGAISIGINTTLYKMVAVLISAILTGIGGVYYLFFIKVIEPSVVFGFSLSIKLIIISVIGGIGSVVGPIIGAIIVVIPEELIRGFFGNIPGFSGIIYGCILILTILLLPKGVNGLISRRLKYLKARDKNGVT